MLNLAISQISNGNVEEGMGKLFKLNYDFPGDINVRRAIAWGHLLQGNKENADRVYAEILADEAVAGTDFLNAGYAKWFMSRIDEAVELFRKYVSSLGEENGKGVLANEFASEKKLLDDNGITVSERHIMVDLV